MGSHYVYKVFRKIKIVKYCKRWPNHIYRTELCLIYVIQKLCSMYVIWPSFTVFYYFNFTKYLVNQKLCLIYVIWPSFTVFYYFNFMKYFVNIMGSH